MSDNELIPQYDYDGSDKESTPLPLYIAELWKFPLAFVDTGDELLYSVHDWIKGLTNDKDVRKAWSRMKPQLSLSTRRLPLTAANGKTYQMDFVEDEGLYKIAAYMRATEKRTLLKSIKDYLAMAGVLIDEAYLDPEGFEERMRVRRTEKYQRIGRPEDWIAARNLSIVTRKEFTSMIYDLLGAGTHFGTITNDVYRGVFNADVKDLRQRLGLTPKQNPRDFFSRLALAYTIAAEEACRIKLDGLKEDDFVPLPLVREIVQTLSEAVGVQADLLANALRIDLVTGRPLLEAGDKKEGE